MCQETEQLFFGCSRGRSRLPHNLPSSLAGMARARMSNRRLLKCTLLILKSLRHLFRN